MIELTGFTDGEAWGFFDVTGEWAKALEAGPCFFQLNKLSDKVDDVIGVTNPIDKVAGKPQDPLVFFRTLLIAIVLVLATAKLLNKVAVLKLTN